jgi:GTP pyrophosphokinase
MGIHARLMGRESTLYSLYQKMIRHNLTFAQVTDIYGFRIVVPTVIDCYTALGVLHQLYKPVPSKFKDHIAIAKNNGYQSLHTTLVGPSGVSVEFQIRTEQMHIVAEAGVAAHWLYKAQAGEDAHLNTKWLQSLLDIQNENSDATEFWDHVKVDLFPDSIYVFTPKSKILAMPRGATVVDFAYAIHSNIGNHVTAAKSTASTWHCAPNSRAAMWWKSSPRTTPRPTRPGWALSRPGAPAPRSATT